jgi:hypothetical protein
MSSTTLTHDRDTNAPPPPAPPTPAEVVAWLDYQLEPLLARRTEIMQALRAFVAAHPKIADGDEELAGMFNDNIGMALECRSKAAGAHKEHKEPYFRAGQAVDAWKNRFIEGLDETIGPVKAVLATYRLRMDDLSRAVREAEARRAREAAARAQQEAAAALRRNAPSTSAKLEAAAAADEQAQKAAEQARAKAPGRSRGMYGTVSSIRTTWTWKLIDISRVPLEFLTINERALDDAKKERDPVSGRPTREIGGIEWVEERGLGVRR